MSLYNMIFGVNPNTEQLLGVLGKTAGDFGRFRNVYVEDGYIVVHTRNGGGNREDYEDVFDEMSEHPWYSHDEDDSFDCTYANIYFKVPEEVEEESDGAVLTFGSILIDTDPRYDDEEWDNE